MKAALIPAGCGLVCVAALFFAPLVKAVLIVTAICCGIVALSKL